MCKENTCPLLNYVRFLSFLFHHKILSIVYYGFQEMALSIYPEESIGHTIRQSWSLPGIFLVLAV